MLSIPKNPLADVFGRMIFVGIPTPVPAQAPAPDHDDDEMMGRISKAEVGQLRRIIGGRLREAREKLCGLTMREAAVLIDVPVKMIQRYEDAIDLKQVNEAFILRAAQAYDVSIDWLYGQTDDFERGSRMHRERHTALWTFRHVERRHLEQMEHLRRLYNQQEAMEREVSAWIEAAGPAIEALDKFMAMPGFNEMRGGANLAYARDRLSACRRSGMATLERVKRGIDFHRVDDAVMAELRGAGD